MKQNFFIFVLFILPSFCALHPEITYTKKTRSYEYRDQVAQVNGWAKNDETSTIHGVIQLKKENGFLSDNNRDSNGFFYEGKLIEGDNRAVAIRFASGYRYKECNEEMEMYLYMKAYQNETVEGYGISNVHFYGEWNGYIVTAFTKFEMDLSDVAKNVESGAIKLTDLDILIFLRDFVFQSKWMHHNGIRHDGITPKNIMIRGHRSFLIGFNQSSKMYKRQQIWSEKYGCKRNFIRTQRAIDDYESFLYTISDVSKKMWFSNASDNADRIHLLDDSLLDSVIKAFAEEVWPSDKKKHFPNYNKLAEKIELAITHGCKVESVELAKFSWKNDVKTSAEDRLKRNIREIPDPVILKKSDYPPIRKDVLISY